MLSTLKKKLGGLASSALTELQKISTKVWTQVNAPYVSGVGVVLSGLLLITTTLLGMSVGFSAYIVIDMLLGGIGLLIFSSELAST